MSVELASTRPLASAAEMKTLPAVNRPMARLSQTKRWRIKDGAWTMTSPISISKLTAQECAARSSHWFGQRGIPADRPADAVVEEIALCARRRSHSAKRRFEEKCDALQKRGPQSLTSIEQPPVVHRTIMRTSNVLQVSPFEPATLRLQL
jgi:hypothetical protein